MELQSRNIIKAIQKGPPSREGLNSTKLGFALSLPFKPRRTDTLLELEHFSDLNVEAVKARVRGLILDVDGTLVSHHTELFAPETVEKLRELIARKIPLCVFSNNNDERVLFHQLHIPVVQNVPPKPAPQGFVVAANRYLDMAPQECAMVGDNILTDGGCARAGMGLILVDPIPGNEPPLHKLTRRYGRFIKWIHDGLRSK